MKAMHDFRCVSKRQDDRAERPSLHSQPSNPSDGRSRPSCQPSAKRKFQSAGEPPPPARKTESVLRSSRGVRSQRQPVGIRKSLSDPLQVFGDGNGIDAQYLTYSSLSGSNPSDAKDRLSKDCKGQHEVIETEKFSRERRCGRKQGLKDSTNIESMAAHKQIRPPMCASIPEVLVLKEALRAEKASLRCLQAELDEERNAASSAANEAMAMIARLQEEKAAVLMEARQFKRMAEERELHNQEAISLLKEMLLNREEEALALENELATSRQMFLAIEAGEPVENFDLVKYLEGGGFNAGNVGAEPESTHFVEGLRTWISSFCDARQFSVSANDFSREVPKEELTSSEFTCRRIGRNIKGLISDNVRSNLVSYFNQAGGFLEESQACNGVDVKKELSEVMFDRTSDSSMCGNMLKGSLRRSEVAIYSSGGEMNCGESFLTKMTCDDPHLEQSFGISKVPTTPHSLEENTLHGKVESAAGGKEEHTRSLWERIMRLEHRLETFGMDEQCLEYELEANMASTSWEPTFAASKHQTTGSYNEMLSQGGQCSQENVMDGKESSERPMKLQCREGSQGIRFLAKQKVDTVQTSQAKLSQDLPGVSGIDFFSRPFIAPEQPSNDMTGDTVEGVHDIYEVDYQGNQRSQKHHFKPLVDDSSGNQPSSYEKPDLPSELTAPDLETMDIESHVSIFTPQVSVAARNASSSLSGAEVQQLKIRLQALETERHCMNQAISSLKKENEELKLLQEIAQQLQDLKRTVQTSKHPSKQAQSDQSSLFSFVKGFLSYRPRSTNSQESNRALPFKNPGFSTMQKDHVGLSYLLENSPHLKTDTLMVRGLKVRVPTAS